MSRFTLLALAASCTFACSSSPTTPSTPDNDAGASKDAAVTETGGGEGGVDPLAGCTRDPGAPAITPTTGNDPTGGAASFTLEKALEGFPAGSGALIALITTEHGNIRCELDTAAAPISVANFVGLARGTRPYLSQGTWKGGRFYDGLLWHRVIPDFVIQGGDPLGTGSGGPGYSIPVENQVAEPLGTLAMAASNEPSGSQFYIVVGTGPAPNYNVFGKCDTEAAIAISKVPRGTRDKPTTPVHMQKVDIARCPK
jgi:peptidyl-prolyl cis-trans isomerase A (cyclophilin A)